MKFMLFYILVCTGLVRFLLTFFGGENIYVNYIDDLLLITSTIYCFFLVFNRKIAFTSLSLFIAAYIVLRIIAVSSFALFNEYDLLGYLFPLKNWIILLNFFIIGQSIDLPEDTVNKFILKALIITTLVIFSFEALSPFITAGFDKLFQLQSRFPFVKYRILIDEFIIVYVYFYLSSKMIKNELSLSKYQVWMAFLILAFLIAQTKQILIAIFIVSLFLITKKYKSYLTKRKFIYTLSFSVASIVLLSGIYLLIIHNPQDTYFSVWRRSLLFGYIQEKISNYPLFGYPIPSNLFGGIIPRDIIHYFYGFNFDVSIFPTDLPFLFILAEEGMVGLLFVVTFLFLSYKKNPEKVSYLIVMLLALIGTFRMYYLNPVGSSFTYFMLGFLTRRSP